MVHKDEKSTTGNQTLFEGHVDEGRNVSSASTQDQTLLKALQDLIVRVVDPKQMSDMNPIHLGPEAGKLITALQEFISSILLSSQSATRNTIEVNWDDEEDNLQEGDHDGSGEKSRNEHEPQADETDPHGNEDDDYFAWEYKWGTSQRPLSAMESDGDESNSGDPDALEKPMLTFEEKLLGALREHIFNTMPIRMLCFEPHVSSFQIALLERGAVFAHLASTLRGKMHEEEFQPHKKRSRKMESIAIERLITQHTKYAILSHTWLRIASGSEVTYANWNKGSLDPSDPGYRKLVNFCKVAWRDYGLTFGWMDTVCINKDSSSELDESIRSMYNWYSRATICIIYLAETETLRNMHVDSWFTRGWTLQELLAPRIIKFYDSHWMRLVNSSDNDKWTAETTEQIERATTITFNELNDIRNDVSISRRMQLAATREVTREEDTAYSLMGIFSVSISTAYGEGAPRAFFRLLQEILVSSTNVLDILNWGGELPESLPSNSRILPPSPQYYLNRSSTYNDVWPWLTEPLTLSHLGLRVPVILMPGMIQEISIQDTASQHRPLGAYYATVNISRVRHSDDESYYLLDKRIFSTNHTDKKDQLTFAVFNFGAAPNAMIRLPKKCRAVGLSFAEPAGQVSSLARCKVIQMKKPIVFALGKGAKDSYSSEKWWNIKRDELAEHGMQLISLHL